MLRDAYCFKRVVIDGDKEIKVANKLRGFRKAQYLEAEKTLKPYRTGEKGFYFKQVYLGEKINQHILNILYTAAEIRKAPGMPLKWIVEAQMYDEENPAENDVSRVIPISDIVRYGTRYAFY